ncbi:MAG: Ig-like domain-containing protein [Acidobacteria bacterium]|nr:Ig-like domain-containing protein [Acidobacteriota bacterium]
MAKGNFSNGGVDTFDPSRRYVGVRLQQGVPLLDRDWNESEDIRRHFERRLRRHYIGQGVSTAAGFHIEPAPSGAPNDFLIQPGNLIVDGWDVQNGKPLLYSQQPGVPPMPAADATQQNYLVYLDPNLTRIGAADEPSLKNSQDVNMETCLRDRLDWTVRIARVPEQPPGDAYILASIQRPPNAAVITADMIADKRRTRVNVADTVDRTNTLEGTVQTLTTQLSNAILDLEHLKQQVARMFWDVSLSASRANSYFGDSVTITASVVNGLGEPVSGAGLVFTSDWGALDPSSVTANSDGRASVTLHAVEAEAPPPKQEIAVLNDLARRVDRSKLEGQEAIQHRLLRFQPQEMMLVSRYTPAPSMIDIASSLTVNPHVTIPRFRTVTVTVHSREGQAAIVRGVGSIQVTFGMWVRDWAVSKIADVVSGVQVGVRVGDILRLGVVNNQTFDHTKVLPEMPKILQRIQDDTHAVVKQTVFLDPSIDDDKLAGSGSLGQLIAQEATAAIGLQTHQAIDAQLNQSTVPIPPDSRTVVTQTAHQISAGFAQSQKQRYNSPRNLR